MQEHLLLFLSLQDRSRLMTKLLHESGNVCTMSSTVKPQPPSRSTDLETRRLTSCHYSRMRVRTVLTSAVCNTVPHVASGRHVQSPTFSLHPRPRAECHLTSQPLCPATTNGSRSFKWCLFGVGLYDFSSFKSKYVHFIATSIKSSASETFLPNSLQVRLVVESQRALYYPLDVFLEAPYKAKYFWLHGDWQAASFAL